MAKFTNPRSFRQIHRSIWHKKAAPHANVCTWCEHNANMFAPEFAPFAVEWSVHEEICQSLICISIRTYSRTIPLTHTRPHTTDSVSIRFRFHLNAYASRMLRIDKRNDCFHNTPRDTILFLSLGRPLGARARARSLPSISQ